MGLFAWLGLFLTAHASLLGTLFAIPVASGWRLRPVGVSTHSSHWINQRICVWSEVLAKNIFLFAQKVQFEGKAKWALHRTLGFTHLPLLMRWQFKKKKNFSSFLRTQRTAITIKFHFQLRMTHSSLRGIAFLISLGIQVKQSLIDSCTLYKHQDSEVVENRDLAWIAPAWLGPREAAYVAPPEGCG